MDNLSTSSQSEVISLVKAVITESKVTTFREYEKEIIQCFQDQFLDLPSIHNQHPDDFANGITNHIGGTFDRDHAIKLLNALKGKINEMTNEEVVSPPESTVEMNIITEVPKTDDSKTDSQIVRMVTEAIDAMIAEKPKNKVYKEFGPQIIDFFRQKGDEYTIDTVTAMTGKELGLILSDEIGSKKVKGVATALLKKLNAMKEQLADVQQEEKKEETTSNDQGETPIISAVKKVIETLKENPKKAPLLDEYGDKIIDYFRTSGIDKERLFKMSNKELGVPLAEYCDGNKKVKGLAGALLKNLKTQMEEAGADNLNVSSHTKSPSVQINDNIASTVLTNDEVIDREEEEKYNKPQKDSSTRPLVNQTNQRSALNLPQAGNITMDVTCIEDIEDIQDAVEDENYKIEQIGSNEV